MLSRLYLYQAGVVESKDSRNFIHTLRGKGDLQGHLVGGISHDFDVTNDPRVSFGSKRDNVGKFLAEAIVGRPGGIGLRVQHHASLRREKHGEQMMVLDYGIALEGVLPPVVSRVGTGLRGVGFKHQQIVRHLFPGASIFDIQGNRERRGGVPQDDISGCLEGLERRKSCGCCQQRKQRRSGQNPSHGPDVLIRFHEVHLIWLSLSDDNYDSRRIERKIPPCWI